MAKTPYTIKIARRINRMEKGIVGGNYYGWDSQEGTHQKGVRYIELLYIFSSLHNFYVVSYKILNFQWNKKNAMVCLQPKSGSATNDKSEKQNLLQFVRNFS